MPKKKHEPDPQIARRIREARERQDLTQEDVAARMPSGVTHGHYGKYERAESGIDLPMLLEIAKALGVPPAALLSDHGGSGRREVPEIGRVAAGNWREAVAMSERTYGIPDYLRGNNLFVLRPDGDSMDQIVQDGGYVVIDPDQRELIDKKLYVIQNGEGEATFKQYMATPPRLVPCSTNPNHEPIILGAEPFIVIGRVIHSGQDH